MFSSMCSTDRDMNVNKTETLCLQCSAVSLWEVMCELNPHKVKIDIEGHRLDVTFIRGDKLMFLFVLVNSSSAQVED